MTSSWQTATKVYHVLVTQACLTLCDSMDCRPPGSSVHGILQATILRWVASPFSRGSSWPRDRTWVSCIADRFFTVWATREAHVTHGNHRGARVNTSSSNLWCFTPDNIPLANKKRTVSGRRIFPWKWVGGSEHFWTAFPSANKGYLLSLQLGPQNKNMWNGTELQVRPLDPQLITGCPADPQLTSSQSAHLWE